MLCHELPALLSAALGPLGIATVALAPTSHSPPTPRRVSHAMELEVDAIPMRELCFRAAGWTSPDQTKQSFADHANELSAAHWLQLGLPLPSEGEPSSAARKVADITAPIDVHPIAKQAMDLFINLTKGMGTQQDPHDPLAGMTDAELEQLHEEALRRRRIHARTEFKDRFKTAKSSFVQGRSYAQSYNSLLAKARSEGIRVNERDHPLNHRRKPELAFVGGSREQVPRIPQTVSYTHLTLPTNREV